jgi:hypothetical protein
VKLRTRSRERGGRRVRAGKADDLMPSLQQLRHDEGTNVPARAGHEYSQGLTSCDR